MGSFKWEKPEIDLNDLIGYNARDLGRLNTTYKWGIKLRDKVWLEGAPMLVVDYDDHDIVAAVWFNWEE